MIHRREMAEPLGQLFTFDHGFKRHRVGKLDLFREGNAGLQSPFRTCVAAHFATTYILPPAGVRCSCRLDQQLGALPGSVANSTKNQLKEAQ